MELRLGEEWHGLPAMTADQKQESTELLRVFATMEHARAAAAMAKNTLEAYIITTRSAINNDEDLALVRRPASGPSGPPGPRGPFRGS